MLSVRVQRGLRCCLLTDALKPKAVRSILREGERVRWAKSKVSKKQTGIVRSVQPAKMLLPVWDEREIWQ
jgi:hypothetical protein